MTNASFSAGLCANLQSTAEANPTLTVGTVTIYGTNNGFLEVPECLWATFGLYSSSLTTVTLSNVVVLGNSSGTSSEVGPSSSDPLMRLPTSIKYMVIRGCTFVDPTTATYAPNWQAFVDRMTQLTNLQVYDSAVGGTIFTTIPAQLYSVTISNCGLTGSISASLLSLLSSTDSSSMNLLLPYNKLTGTIPGALFSNFAHGRSFSTGSFDLRGNKISGSIPDALLSATNFPTPSFYLYIGNNSLTGSLPSSMCASCPVFTLLDISMNQLSGPVSSSLFDAYFATGAKSFQLYASNNSFTGSVPALFGNMPVTRVKRSVTSTIAVIRVDFSHNKFTSAGLNVVANNTIYVPNFQEINLSFNQITSLPEHFLDSYTSTLSVDLTGNKLTTLPAGFLHGITFENPNDVTVLLGENLLTSLPDDLFNSSLTFSSLSFNISHNPTLTGSLPVGLTSLAASSIFYYTLDFSHCGFTGAIPSMPFVNEVDYLEISFASNRLNNGSSGFHMSSFIDLSNTDGIYGIDLDVSDNAFTGPLDVTGLSVYLRDTLLDDSASYLNFSGNSFTSFGLDDIWASTIFSLDISRNTLMTSAIFPESLFNDSSVIRSLYASKTGITGVFPMVTNADFSRLYALDFSGSSGIDFCSGNRTAWTTDGLSICKLYLTTAANCSDLYPSNCEFSAPPEAPPVEMPVESPSADPSSPVAPSAPGTPSSTPVAPGTPSSTPVAPGTPSSTPIRPPTGAATATSASLVAIAFAALIALVASV